MDYGDPYLRRTHSKEVNYMYPPFPTPPNVTQNIRRQYFESTDFHFAMATSIMWPQFLSQYGKPQTNLHRVYYTTARDKELLPINLEYK